MAPSDSQLLFLVKIPVLLAHTLPLSSTFFLSCHIFIFGASTRVWFTVPSRCGTMLIQILLSLSRSFTTIQRCSGRTMACGPAGKGPTNISSSTVHSSKFHLLRTHFGLHMFLRAQPGLVGVFGHVVYVSARCQGSWGRHWRHPDEKS